MDDNTPLDLLLGRHSYGMSPELETDWFRVFLVAGIIVGAVSALVVCGLIRIIGL